MPETPTSPYEWIGRASAGALLALALVTNQMGLWVWKGTVEDVRTQMAEVKKDRDEWKQLALQGTNLARKAADDRVVGVMESPAPVNSTDNKDDVRAALEKLSERLQK